MSAKSIARGNTREPETSTAKPVAPELVERGGLQRANKLNIEQREQTLSVGRIRTPEDIQIAKGTQVHLAACGSQNKCVASISQVLFHLIQLRALGR